VHRVHGPVDHNRGSVHVDSRRHSAKGSSERNFADAAMGEDLTWMHKNEEGTMVVLTDSSRWRRDGCGGPVMRSRGGGAWGSSSRCYGARNDGTRVGDG
jgi:hypothetical protein